MPGTDRRTIVGRARRGRPGPPAEGGAGLAVDSRGNPAIDPTENVKALSEAAHARQDDLREMHTRLMNAELRHLEHLSNERTAHTEAIAVIREKSAETIRKMESDRLDKNRQFDLQTANTAADRALVAIQTLAASQAQAAETLRALVTSTAASVATQTTASLSAITERIAALEVSRYKGEGKEAVADPMIAQLLGEVKSLRDNQTGSAGKSQGMYAVWAILGSTVALIVGLITIGTFAFITTRQPSTPQAIYTPAPAGTQLPTTPPAQVPR
jgi:hypothetical protein